MGNHRDRHGVRLGRLSGARVDQVVHHASPSLPAPAADGRCGHGALLHLQARDILGWFPGIGDADRPARLAGGCAVSVQIPPGVEQKGTFSG